MVGAVGAVGAGDVSALYAASLAYLQRLAATRAGRDAGAGGVGPVGVDRYTPSVPGAAPAVTYNRFGRIDGAPSAVPTARPAVDPAAASLGQRSAPSGYTPAQVAHAYGFDKTGLTGAGQAIAVVTAFHSPTVRQDLAAFDRAFGLPDPALEVVNQKGGAAAGASDSGWALETALDVEWAHAVAPRAKVVLVEANSASLTDLTAAIDTARRRPEVSVVSLSFGTAEFPQELRYDSVLTRPPGHGGITFVAASGDSGAGTLWPSASPNVLSVGGTTLLTSPAGACAGEVGWAGSGGGLSALEIEPGYQRGVQSTGWRSNPDVAYDAAPQTGFRVYQGGAWQTVGGTSAGAPQWAGLIALADQRRAQRGLAPLDQAQAQVYNLPAADFHDVVVGSNDYFAGVGYDYVTGRGGPVADRVINDLSVRVTAPSVRLPVNLEPVSIAALLFRGRWK